MKALPTLGLRGRFILLLLALFFALVGFSVWQAVQDKARRLDDATAYLLRSAKLVAARQINVEAQADAILSSLMLRPALRPGASTTACEQLLAARLKQETAFINIGRALPNGGLYAV